MEEGEEEGMEEEEEREEAVVPCLRRRLLWGSQASGLVKCENSFATKERAKVAG